MKRNAFLCWTIAATMLLTLCCGCGSGRGSMSGPTSISPAQATAAATQIEQTFVAASAQMGASFCGNPFNPTGQYFCTIDVASTVDCSSGGTVAITGSNSGDLDYSNTGSATMSLIYTPTNCSIAGTNLVMNANPGPAFTGSMFYFYGGVSSFTATETGSITYGPNPTGVCQTNLTIAANFEGDAQHTTEACMLTGTACGQTVNQNCQ
jgi:hypothetical protein